ncbi:MAG TPA: glutathione S-transferase family protein [Phenylobacterium sp.]|uniref:glutathione S-transferase family protein n=1 Tax=Phenylobacterium sp. TaxID=1871053 RepID=UPI002B608B81|nr:glutathione S-transferase family protein [Phenylobacterium sp.]HSV01979.1 glutathione S-transferase family protein [Phenylobacterium sp.]
MLVLHAHPLSSFCMKVEMALYELGTPFRMEFLDLADAPARERFHALWPIGLMPVLRDEARGETVPETSIIVDYLTAFHPGATELIPKDPEQAWRARFWDRLFDLHVQGPMQRVSEHRRDVPGARDEAIPEIARRRLGTAYDVVEREIGEAWMLGEALTIADCAAAPALFYADRILPLEKAHPRTAAYLERLKARPSFARALADAEPYLQFVPF